MLVYGQDKAVMTWAYNQLKMKPLPENSYCAIGITHQGKDIGACIWHNYHQDNWGNPLLIEVTLVTIDKRWATRQNIRELFYYPFCQLGVKRVQATCHRKAKRVRTTLKRLGFSYEGIVREAHPLGGDAAHYSMLKTECKWIVHGQKRAFSTTSTRSNDYGSGSNQEQPGNCTL